MKITEKITGRDRERALRIKMAQHARALTEAMENGDREQIIRERENITTTRQIISEFRAPVKNPPYDY